MVSSIDQAKDEIYTPRLDESGVPQNYVPNVAVAVTTWYQLLDLAGKTARNRGELTKP